MRAVVRRDLIVSARRPALMAALALFAAISALFLYAWGRAATVPGLPGGNLYEQISVVQRVLVMVLAPWVAVRIAGVETREDLARMALLLNLPAARIERSRYVSVLVWMLLLVLAGLPASLLAQQMSAASMGDLARGTAGLAGVAAAAALVAITLGRWIDDGIAKWTLATCSLALVAILMGRV